MTLSQKIQSPRRHLTLNKYPNRSSSSLEVTAVKTRINDERELDTSATAVKKKSQGETGLTALISLPLAVVVIPRIGIQLR